MHETNSTIEQATWQTKVGLAQMLKGGVIMDVVTPEQARIAEEAGAVAVMALERVPADIRREGGVARMADPERILRIKEAVTIPVMAKVRIGHFVEAQILEAIGVDFIDESEVLTPADDRYHIDKHQFRVPFVCGARDLGEALRRIAEGAAMIRSKGEAGTGNIVEAVRHLRDILDGIRRLAALPREELVTAAKELGAPYELVRGRSPSRDGCPSCSSVLVAWRRRPTRHWSCSWAPRASSSAPASSSRRTRSPVPKPSSRRSRTIGIRRYWRASRAVSARRCRGSTWRPWRPSNAWHRAAGEEGTDEPDHRRARAPGRLR